MLKMNKEYDGWENDFKSTKSFICICVSHQCILEENEEYAFRQHEYDIVKFDEDEVDLSGMMCREEDCDMEHWIAIEVKEE